MPTVLSWIESEPVVTRVGLPVGVVVGVLLVRETAERSTFDLVLAVLGLLLVLGGVAGARAAVVPTATLRQSGDVSGHHTQDSDKD